MLTDPRHPRPASPVASPPPPIGAPLCLGDVALTSRLLLGSAGYPSPAVLAEAVRASGAQVVTAGLRRAAFCDARSAREARAVEALRTACEETGARLLPNTAGCRSAREAVLLAEMAGELFETSWVKLEITGDEFTLAPDPFELVDAARELVRLGFEVLPYCTDDLVVCRHLLDAGCRVLMPGAAPIGSARGLLDPTALATLRARLPDATLVIDAGLGAPSHAALAMEMGFDAVLVNSAVSQAVDPARMAAAFARGVAAGRMGYEAGLVAPQDAARPSTPVSGEPILLDEPVARRPGGPARADA